MPTCLLSPGLNRLCLKDQTLFETSEAESLTGLDNKQCLMQLTE